MSLLRRMFNRPYRKARAAEGAGDYRRAAALYIEAELPDEAANALLFHAARASTLDDRLAAYHDALRWLPAGHPRRAEVQGQIGIAVLDDAQRRGARSAEEKRRLEDAAGRLERTGRWADAATAWELLGRSDAMAKCLERAGDIERLERLLDRTSAAEDRERRLRRLVNDYELAMRVGARVDALDALRDATRVAPEDTAVADLRRRLETRLPDPHRVTLEIDGRPVAFVGRLPAVIGRAGADVSVRGASVSRRHAQVALSAGKLVMTDLDSRNGTLVRGVPIAGSIELAGPTEVGLGDDVSLRVAPSGDGVLIEVERGLDRGVRVVVGEGRLELTGFPATVSFPRGHATVEAHAGTKMVLGTQPCAAPVTLLLDDSLGVGPHRVRVSR